jgi:hypothetical protein
MITYQDAIDRLIKLVDEVREHNKNAMWKLGQESGDLDELTQWLRDEWTNA